MRWHFELRNCRGYRYLYLVQKARTPKGPRNVRQIHVGSADRLFERMTQPPRYLKSFPFGRSAALLHAARRTGLWDALLRHLPAPSARAAWLLLVQILARAEKPLSREGMARWFPESSLPLLTPWAEPPSGRVLRSALRDLYDTGDQTDDGIILTRARVRAIQEDIFRTLRQQGLEPRLLLFDGTNEFVHHRAGLWTRKGKSKARRYDKNLIGLGMVTMETIPVLSEVYPGNRNDMDTFPELFDALLTRLERLEVATDKLLLVVDRGVNSVDNFDKVLGAMHVCGGAQAERGQGALRAPSRLVPEGRSGHRGTPGARPRGSLGGVRSGVAGAGDLPSGRGGSRGGAVGKGQGEGPPEGGRVASGVGCTRSRRWR